MNHQGICTNQAPYVPSCTCGWSTSAFPTQQEAADRANLHARAATQLIPGVRVLVDLGLGEIATGVIHDHDDLGVGVLLDNSDGSIWRTHPSRVMASDA